MLHALTFRTHLEIDNIHYLKGTGNYTVVMMANGQQLMLSKNIAYLLAHLPEATFLRVSKTYAVNLAHSSQLSLKYPNCYVQMNTGEKFEISRRKAIEMRRIEKTNTTPKVLNQANQLNR